MANSFWTTPICLRSSEPLLIKTCFWGPNCTPNLNLITLLWPHTLQTKKTTTSKSCSHTTTGTDPHRAFSVKLFTTSWWINAFFGSKECLWENVPWTRVFSPTKVYGRRNWGNISFGGSRRQFSDVSIFCQFRVRFKTIFFVGDEKGQQGQQSMILKIPGWWFSTCWFFTKSYLQYPDDIQNPRNTWWGSVWVWNP